MFTSTLVIPGLMLVGVIAMPGMALSDHGGVPTADRVNGVPPPALVMLAAAGPERWVEPERFHGPMFEPKRLHVPEHQLQVFDSRVVERLPVNQGWLSRGAGYAGYVNPSSVPQAIRPGETAADILGAGGMVLWKW